MATVPLSGTNIRLLTGVPFSNDYKNTRWFDTQTEQTNYFRGKATTHTRSDYTFQRIEGRHFIRVSESIDKLWGTNYLMFQNTQYNSKWFYAFVTKLEYVSKQHTDVYFQIDVFQTWRFDYNFKPSYIVREHCPLWNADGTPVINTIDEGLNYGTEYETVSVEQYRPYNDLLFLVIIAKSALHGGPSTTINKISPNTNGVPQPLSYYIHPFKIDRSGVSLDIGGSKPLSHVLDTLKSIFSYEDAVNNIVSLYVTEFFGKAPISYDGTTLSLDRFAFESAQIPDKTETNKTVNTIYVSNIIEYESIVKDMGSKYKDFTTPKESKLLMHPYTVTVLDDFRGGRVEIKNEQIYDKNLKLRMKGSLSTSNKTAYCVDNYGVIKSGDADTLSMEHSLVSNSPNDISIVSDYLSAFLQGNRNSLDQQKTNAVFNATIGAMTGGMVGMASSSYTYGAGGGARRSALNPYGAGAAVLQVAGGVGQSILEMQGIQAKLRDVNNTPPSLVKMGGNTSFDYGNKYSGVYVVKKQIKPEYRNTLSDFFNMFGYKVNRVKQPNFHTRRYWNYVQTTNCLVTGNFNNDDLTELKAVFDNGITFWHTDDVGNYALDNGVL